MTTTLIKFRSQSEGNIYMDNVRSVDGTMNYAPTRTQQVRLGIGVAGGI